MSKLKIQFYGFFVLQNKQWSQYLIIHHVVYNQNLPVASAPYQTKGPHWDTMQPREMHLHTYHVTSLCQSSLEPLHQPPEVSDPLGQESPISILALSFRQFSPNDSQALFKITALLRYKSYTLLSEFNGLWYIRRVMQPSPLSHSRTFSSA